MSDEQQAIGYDRLRKQLMLTRLIAIAALIIGLYPVIPRPYRTGVKGEYVMLNPFSKSETGKCMIAGSGEGLMLVFSDDDLKSQFSLALGVQERQVVVRDANGKELRSFSLDSEK